MPRILTCAQATNISCTSTPPGLRVTRSEQLAAGRASAALGLARVFARTGGTGGTCIGRVLLLAVLPILTEAEERGQQACQRMGRRGLLRIRRGGPAVYTATLVPTRLLSCSSSSSSSSSYPSRSSTYIYRQQRAPRRGDDVRFEKPPDEKRPRVDGVGTASGTAVGRDGSRLSAFARFWSRASPRSCRAHS